MSDIPFGTVTALTERREGQQRDDRLDSYHPAEVGKGRAVFHREVTDSRTQEFGDGSRKLTLAEEQATYRRHRVSGFTHYGGSWQVRFKERMPMSLDTFGDELFGPSPQWSLTAPAEMPQRARSAVEWDPDVGEYRRVTAERGESPDWEYTRWEQPRPAHPEAYPEPKSCDDLSFAPLSGDGSLRLVNQFLAGGPDGRVWHRRCGVDGWRYAFGVAYDGHLISVAVVEHPHNAALEEYDETVYLTRLASHPHRPHNTSSWFLARIRGWLCHNTEYDKLVALAGIDGNEGICYDAAGFSREGSKTVTPGQETAYSHTWKKTRWTTAL